MPIATNTYVVEYLCDRQNFDVIRFINNCIYGNDNIKKAHNAAKDIQRWLEENMDADGNPTSPYWEYYWNTLQQLHNTFVNDLICFSYVLTPDWGGGRGTHSTPCWGGWGVKLEVLPQSPVGGAWEGFHGGPEGCGYILTKFWLTPNHLDLAHARFHDFL